MSSLKLGKLDTMNKDMNTLHWKIEDFIKLTLSQFVAETYEDDFNAFSL